MGKYWNCAFSIKNNNNKKKNVEMVIRSVLIASGENTTAQMTFVTYSNMSLFVRTISYYTAYWYSARSRGVCPTVTTYYIISKTSLPTKTVSPCNNNDTRYPLTPYSQMNHLSFYQHRATLYTAECKSRAHRFYLEMSVVALSYISPFE